MIHGMFARSAAASMPPPSPVQRKAVLLPVIAVGPGLPTLVIMWATMRAIVRPIAALAVCRLLMLLRLIAGDERGQAIDIALIFRIRMLGTRLKMLLMLLRLVVLRLMVMLFARVIRLRLARREWLAADMWLLAVVAVVTLIGSAHLAGLLLLIIGLTLPELFLRCGNNAEIVLGVLVVIFRRNRVPGALRIARELEIFFGHVGCRPANFYVRSIGLIHSR
jgi:hypothetical protein